MTTPLDEVRTGVGIPRNETNDAFRLHWRPHLRPVPTQPVAAPARGRVRVTELLVGAESAALVALGPCERVWGFGAHSSSGQWVALGSCAVLIMALAAPGPSVAVSCAAAILAVAVAAPGLAPWLFVALVVGAVLVRWAVTPAQRPTLLVALAGGLLAAPYGLGLIAAPVLALVARRGHPGAVFRTGLAAIVVVGGEELSVVANAVSHRVTGSPLARLATFITVAGPHTIAGIGVGLWHQVASPATVATALLWATAAATGAFAAAAWARRRMQRRRPRERAAAYAAFATLSAASVVLAAVPAMSAVFAAPGFAPRSLVALVPALAASAALAGARLGRQATP